MKSTAFHFSASLLFAAAIWAFWFLLFPQALGFQEQNQLFLFTASYLVERLSVCGGLSDYISEFLTQFNYIPALGALVLALLFTLLQYLIWTASGKWNTKDSGEEITSICYPLSFAAPLMMLVCMGDIYVLPSYLTALCLVTALSLAYLEHPSTVLAVIAVPLGYWLIGPVIWVFTITVILKCRKAWSLKRWILKGWILMPLYTALTAAVLYLTLNRQYPLAMTLFGINYYRLPMIFPPTMFVTAGLCAFIPPVTSKLSSILKKKALSGVLQTASVFAVTLVLLSATLIGIKKCYDRDTYELIAYDQLTRVQKWQQILDRASEYQPESDIGCVSVNLALMMTGRMNQMDNYYQCGTQGLVMPRVRDLISNVSSYEVFWRMGFVNSALRYAFDSQESTANNRKSGRHTSKMAECHIVNGNYAAAAKYLDILSHSLFYSKWAESRRSYLNNEAKIDSDPIYGYLRQARFKDDFLYNYIEMDTMMAILYNHDHNNIMAAEYYTAYRRLEEKYGRYEEK